MWRLQEKEIENGEDEGLRNWERGPQIIKADKVSPRLRGLSEEIVGFRGHTAEASEGAQVKGLALRGGPTRQMIVGSPVLLYIHE